MANTRDDSAPAPAPAPGQWAPRQYRNAARTEARRNRAYAGADTHKAVMVSTLHYHPEWTREQFAERFREVIDRYNGGGWGQTWTLTDEHVRDLADSSKDFETAWRAIDHETVSAYGV